MSRQTEDKLQDFYKWYLEHEMDMKQSDFSKRLEAMHKMLYNCLWVITYLVEDIQALEGRLPTEGESILTPAGLKLDQNLRQGGDPR
jgi:hypothetical protein